MFKKLQSRLSKRKSRRNQLPRTLACETLAKRELMAADIVVARDQLFVSGDHNDDQISVSTVVPSGRPSGGTSDGDREFVGPIFPYGSIEVRVTDDRGFAQSNFYDPSSIQFINIDTGNGDNTVDIDVSIPTRIFGGSGEDTINGGESFDWIDGGNGNDFIWGHGGDDIIKGEGGNDVIEGGAGNDVIRGGANRDEIYGDYRPVEERAPDVIRVGEGDDELWGGSDDDQIFGGGGNDRIFGNPGNDVLEGGHGNDALIGGRGDDTFTTGAGQDRVLVRDGEQDDVTDLAEEDVRITFTDTTQTETRNNGEREVEPGAWSDIEVERVDAAFQMLFDATGNNSLLRSPRFEELRFVRRGDVFEIDSNGRREQNFLVGAWNHLQSAEISITNNTDLDDYIQVVIHEVGHEFDQPSENRFVDDFRKAAKWIKSSDVDLSGDVFTQAEGKRYESWYFLTSTGDSFVDDYGKVNPNEDFATSFTAKMMTDNDLDYERLLKDADDDWFAVRESPEEARERLKLRFGLLDKFFASLT